MKVKMQILKDSEVLEEYVVPDGSWIQTESLGAQHVPAITVTTDYLHETGPAFAPIKHIIRFTPISPPKIPPQLQKLLDSRDSRFGRDGWEWIGSHREKAGGTTLDRAREACWGLEWRRDFPLREDPAVREFCETEIRKA